MENIDKVVDYINVQRDRYGARAEIQPAAGVSTAELRRPSASRSAGIGPGHGVSGR